MGRFSFSDSDSDEQDWLKRPTNQEEEEETCPCGTEGCPACREEEEEDEFIDDEEREEEPIRRKVWGDEVIEKKKFNFEKKEKKEDKKDKKEDKKEEKGKGLSASQKKLPEGLRKAILARKKK